MIACPVSTKGSFKSLNSNCSGTVVTFEAFLQLPLQHANFCTHGRSLRLYQACPEPTSASCNQVYSTRARLVPVEMTTPRVSAGFCKLLGSTNPQDAKQGNLLSQKACILHVLLCACNLLLATWFQDQIKDSICNGSC